MLWYCRVTFEVGPSFSLNAEKGVTEVPVVTGATVSLATQKRNKDPENYERGRNAPVVDPNPVVAGLLPNNPPPPPNALVVLVAAGWPNSPVPVDVFALLAVDPNAPPPPNVEVVPPPKAPNPVAGFGAPKSVLWFELLVVLLANAPVCRLSDPDATWSETLTRTKTARCASTRAWCT